jgi:phosphoglycolate phosphatase
MAAVLPKPAGARYVEAVLHRLLLFDVDGTLVRAGDLGAAVFDVALEDVLGVRPGSRVRMSGKTDPQIVREYLVEMGIDETPQLVEAVLRGVEGHLAAAAAAGELASGGTACPGVADLLARLAEDPSVLSTLVTGNVQPNALVKVAVFGLDRWLDLAVGAYGSDEHDRNLLVPIAIERVRTERGFEVPLDNIWVIGDTPRDLECARAAGVRCLLVATGRYSPTDLEVLGADAVLDDLTDTEAVMKVLTG